MTVPKGVPPLIRAGTGTGCPGCFRNALPEASFGVQGALVASRLGPLPLMCQGLPARYLAACHPVRSGAVPHKGQGSHPCTPARCARNAGQPNQCFADCHSGWCSRRLLGASKKRFYFSSPSHMETTNRSSNIIAETFQGCLRFRVYEYETITGQNQHGVEISAWNQWAKQFKVLFFEGGVTSNEAIEGVKELRRILIDYDWMNGDYVFAK